MFQTKFFLALLLLFQTLTPQKCRGGTRANSGRKSKKRRTLSIIMIKARTRSAQLCLHQEKYKHQMKKVKPLLITCTVVILARILGF